MANLQDGMMRRETRRGILKGGMAAAGAMFAGSALQAAGPLVPALSRLPRRFDAPVDEVRPALLARARAALDEHRGSIAHPELVGIVDCTRRSADARFHLVHMDSGRVASFLVAHGRGSDPEHSGWVQSFSNAPGSLATSRGTYVTGERYSGKYGLSLRLSGLDYSNDRALERAIVVHGAPYVGEHMIRDFGKLGRSEGCFAVAQTDLYGVMARLPPGHMIFADKA